MLENLSDNLPTTCNKIQIEKTKLLSHKDVFCIADRSFRIEYSENPDSMRPKTELLDEVILNFNLKWLCFFHTKKGL